MAKPLHLVKRFIGGVIPRGPSTPDAEWAVQQLSPAEIELWHRMSRADRRHAAAVAHRVDDALEGQAAQPVLAAALLHDVGKVDAGLGTYGRVIATLSAIAIRHDPAVIKAWTKTTGMTRRVGLYLQHPRLGGDMLALAGADPLTEAWAREHHLPETEWTVEPTIARALKDADDD